MDIRFLGHAAFALEHDGKTVLIDPFLTGNPKAAASADEVAADAILLTHGHGDHFGDTVAIAKRTGATVVAITEIADEIGRGGRRGRSTPTSAARPSSTGARCASTPALAHVDDAQGHGQHARRASSSRSATSASTTSATPRCSATSRCPSAAGTSTSRSCASAATTRWTASTPWSPPSWSAPTRSSRATTTPSRPIETDAQAFKSDVQNAGFAEVVVLEPGETHTP